MKKLADISAFTNLMNQGTPTSVQNGVWDAMNAPFERFAAGVRGSVRGSVRGFKDGVDDERSRQSFEKGKRMIIEGTILLRQRCNVPARHIHGIVSEGIRLSYQ